MSTLNKAGLPQITLNQFVLHQILPSSLNRIVAHVSRYINSRPLRVRGTLLVSCITSYINSRLIWLLYTWTSGIVIKGGGRGGALLKEKLPGTFLLYVLIVPSDYNYRRYRKTALCVKRDKKSSQDMEANHRHSNNFTVWIRRTTHQSFFSLKALEMHYFSTMNAALMHNRCGIQRNCTQVFVLK